MNGTQKAIKAFAIGLACLIIVCIISAVVGVAVAITGGIDRFDAYQSNEGYTSEDLINFYQEYDNISSMNISTGSVKLKVEEGSIFSIEAVNVPSGYEINVSESGKLTISGSGSSSWFRDWLEGNISWDISEPEIIITIKEGAKLGGVYLDVGSSATSIEGIEAENFVLESGSGKVEIEDVSADSAMLDTGSGKVHADGLNVAEGLTVEAGSGSVSIESASADEASFGLASGRFTYQGSLTGTIVIEGRSGSASFEIDGDEDEYSFVCSEGSGGIWIDGDKVGDYVNQRGKANSINVDGGSGRITIEFE